MAKRGPAGPGGPPEPDAGLRTWRGVHTPIAAKLARLLMLLTTAPIVDQMVRPGPPARRWDAVAVARACRHAQPDELPAADDAP